VKLVVPGDFFYDPGVGVFEQDKISQVVEQQLRRKEAPHHFLQLELQQRPVILVANRAPREKPFAVRRERIHTRVQAIGDHQRFIKDN
jgi:hypothetical protein